MLLRKIYWIFENRCYFIADKLSASNYMHFRSVEWLADYQHVLLNNQVHRWISNDG